MAYSNNIDTKNHRPIETPKPRIKHFNDKIIVIWHNHSTKVLFQYSYQWVLKVTSNHGVKHRSIPIYTKNIISDFWGIQHEIYPIILENIMVGIADMVDIANDDG